MALATWLRWERVAVPSAGVLALGVYLFVMGPVLSVEECEAGVLRSRLRDHGGALERFSRALVLEPGNAVALKGRAWARYWAGTGYRESIDDFNRAIALGAADADTYAGRGLARLSRGLYPSAQQDFRESLARSAGSVLGHLGLGLLEGRIGKPREGLEQLSVALEGAEFDLAVLERGILRGMVGDAPGAREDLETAVRKTGLQLKLNEESAWSHLLRGRAYTYLGLFTKDPSAFPNASRDLDRAAELNPEGDAAYLARATLEFYQDHFEPAAAQASLALARNPSQDEALALRAAAYALLGKKGEEAEKDAQAALDRNPGNPWAYMARGKARESGRAGDAGTREDLRTCLSLAPVGWPYRAKVESWLAQ